MKAQSLLEKDVHVFWEKFGPDPVLMKKKGLSNTEPRDISIYKKKIVDENYLEHAIDRIAMELSHFLSK